jgi:alpha-1,3-glucosyltransferase
LGSLGGSSGSIDRAIERIHRLAKGPGSGRYDRIVGLSIAMHPGFLILDSIHFQYNAFLFGLMAWSLVGAKESKPVLCAGAFATLLMFK